MCIRGPLRDPKDDPYIAESFHIRGCQAVRVGAKCSCPLGRTSWASGVLTIDHFAREGFGSQLRDIWRFARKSIQKSAKFFLACARAPFAPGNDCFLEEPLCIQLQRNAASQCPRSKLFLHLRIEFDSDRHRNLIQSYYRMPATQSRPEIWPVRLYLQIPDKSPVPKSEGAGPPAGTARRPQRDACAKCYCAVPRLPMRFRVEGAFLPLRFAFHHFNLIWLVPQLLHFG